MDNNKNSTQTFTHLTLLKQGRPSIFKVSYHGPLLNNLGICGRRFSQLSQLRNPLVFHALCGFTFWAQRNIVNFTLSRLLDISCSFALAFSLVLQGVNTDLGMAESPQLCQIIFPFYILETVSIPKILSCILAAPN